MVCVEVLLAALATAGVIVFGCFVALCVSEEIDMAKMIGEEYMGVVQWRPPKTWI
jgi:hypothetical protein